MGMLTNVFYLLSTAMLIPVMLALLWSLIRSLYLTGRVLREQAQRVTLRHGLQAFAEADRRFHEAIVAAAGNTLLLRTYRGLRDRQLCLMAADLRMSTGRMDLSIREHEHLLRELTTGTRAGFVRLTRGHLQGAAHRLRESR